MPEPESPAVADDDKRRRIEHERFFELMPDLLAILGPDGMLRRANGSWLRVLGWDGAELLGTRNDWIFHPDDLHRANNALVKMAAGDGPFKLEVRMRTKEGAYRSIKWMALSVPSEQGVYFLGRDVTEDRQAEADLRASEQLLRERARLSELTADVGIALTRGDTLREILQTCVESMASRLDVALAKIWTIDEGKRVLGLQASAGIDRALDGPFSRIPLDSASLISAIARRKTARWTNDVASDPDLGDRAWASREGITAFAGHPLLVDGEVVGVAAAFSKTPFSDATLKALNGVADAIALGVRRKLVEQSKADLEAQLRQAQRMEAVGSLAGGIAHDFNNLLSVILSYSSMLVDDLAPGDRVREDLIQIKAAGERAASLTRQLLAFSRRQILQPRVLDLNEIVAGLTTMLHRLIGETIDFATFPANAEAMVNVDPAQMEQVIVNLAVNARDAMPKGGKLTIELQEVMLDAAYRAGHPDVTPGPYVLLAVSDTGTGMDEATQARIFEPFFTTKEVGKGTGLGLSTVFGIVRQSGGHIWVYSEPGRGSTFKIYLPVATQRAEEVAPPAEPTVDLHGTETVLLVEDEEQVRKLAHAILTRAGYRVIEAANGAEALRLPGTRVDLLLTDMVMPRVSGVTLAAQLSVQRPGLRVVFMSGYTDTSAGEQGLPPGAVFVQKPFTPELLLRKVRQALTEAPKTPVPKLVQPRVMLVDDQVVMLRLMARALAQYDLTQFSDPGEALAKVRAGERFDAIVCDVYMPGMTGPVFQEQLRKLDPAQARHMLFLTGALLGSEMADFLHFNMGRVLHKPIDLEALRRAVAGVLAKG
ncbi:MAG TPA: response regulator [Myxococcales bacterium]|nr:response regulator [Myxococcales bacterium]